MYWVWLKLASQKDWLGHNEDNEEGLEIAMWTRVPAQRQLYIAVVHCYSLEKHYCLATFTLKGTMGIG